MASFDMNNVVAGAIQGGVVGSCLGWYSMRRPSRALRIHVTSFDSGLPGRRIPCI